MILKAVCEYNEGGCLVYAEDFPGAYVRGRSFESAVEKFPREIGRYLLWANGEEPQDLHLEMETVLKKESTLNIRDADSDIIFPSEHEPLTKEEYTKLKILALRSAMDFERLYDSVPDKKAPLVPERETFYGKVPSTAEEMYLHTMNVNSYYFGEIGVDVENGPDILSCREKGFEKLEKREGYLQSPVLTGSYDEEWSLRKLLRRFIWHDRIHAKAMYRRAYEVFWDDEIDNVFCCDRK